MCEPKVTALALNTGLAYENAWSFSNQQVRRLYSSQLVSGWSGILRRRSTVKGCERTILAMTVGEHYSWYIGASTGLRSEHSFIAPKQDMVTCWPAY